QAHIRAPESPLSDFFAFAPLSELNAVVGQQAEIINGQAVSGGYYTGLGVQPMLGRAITDEDDRPGAAPVVVLSHQFWQERFGANPAVTGQSLKLNQQSFTIIGVTPPGFNGTLQVDYRPAVTVPIASEPLLLGENSNLSTANEPGGYWWLDLMGRLKPGATREQARASLNGAFQAAALEVMPPPRRADEPARLDPKDYPRLLAESGSRGMLDERRGYAPTIYGLFIVVALVLLIACANIANLLLARAASRSAEISVRLAVGAGRGRLIRQLLTESVLLASLGGALGALFALWGNSALVTLTDRDTGLLPSNVDLNVNWRVLAFTMVVSLLTGVLFGLAPAWRATSLDLTTALKQGRRTTGAVSRLSKGLIVAQVALSLLLLVGAGVFLRTLHNLQRVNLGFNQENLLVFRLQPEQGGYKDERLIQFYQQLFARLDQLPGVRAATFGRRPLIVRGDWAHGILLPGEVEATATRRLTSRQAVRENYFATLEIPFLRGRNFTAQDDARAPQVAIVNQTFAREFFPNDDALGKRITFRRANRTVEIVGVVADSKHSSQRRDIRPLLYTPWRQEGELIGRMHFMARTVGEPTALAAAVQHVVRELDSNLPVTEVSSQTARSQATLGQERLSARLLSFFGGLALMLAAIGLSGVLAYSVSQRTNEIGIRMALGAQTANVLRMVIWQGMKLVLLGLTVGAASGYGLKRLLADQSLGRETWQARMAEQLYGVSVTDPLTVAVIALLLILVALLACWIPARRATKVDPMTALRCE
ncbi:MAG TPA: ABC transporter permease, partial [Blastocatellia bacterium]|nr:ABC transporter permease [Blastocatellia bacterium]